ncbi:metal-sensitive transcriptional regulator [Bacillus sp. FJAT-27445]|uniref:metal-sensitive transcriptional regulator n=1 Tax=Bacillus sp. FJAT-27445 TaxID=1679166 RepID=UPI0009EA4696|nr:metal-sensitive transcriptional regulator [Bacillus sp. FJAT-27445]
MNHINPDEIAPEKESNAFGSIGELVPECDNHCDSEGSVRKSHHSEKTKRNLVARLNRIEGQIRGIKGLIEKDTYCDDVITQISATQAALNSVAKLLLEGHMKSCVVERIQEGDHEVVDELLVTIQRLMKK